MLMPCISTLTLTIIFYFRPACLFSVSTIVGVPTWNTELAPIFNYVRKTITRYVYDVPHLSCSQQYPSGERRCLVTLEVYPTGLSQSRWSCEDTSRRTQELGWSLLCSQDSLFPFPWNSCMWME